ncbi:hypothetical protein [Streptococcus sp. sy004]|uniref:hypothetical protein n=1 Tax=Streptococcus sp. sy004 TaxID=2600149 RepID=UPI0011B7EA47|nr:hypothetical protein [Streptococcus sp. sy004]TWT12214.1 hypothetical protein FRX54_01420 [Streptococcus sp. sy004]
MTLTKKQWLVLVILLAVTSYGIDTKVAILASYNDSLDGYSHFLLVYNLIGLYFIPFVYDLKPELA